MDDHKQALSVLDTVRQKVADYAKKILNDSVRSGSTPSNPAYLTSLDTYYKKLMEAYPTLSETDKNIVSNGVNNFTKTTLAAAYNASLAGNKREVDNTMPPEVTDKFVADNTKRISEMRTKLQNAMTQLMADSIRTGNTPSKEQTIAYLRMTAGDLITDYGADKQSAIYLTNYITPWVKDTLGNVYDYSLKISPRNVNKRLPWTPADAKVDDTPKSNANQKNLLSDYQKTNQSFSGSDMVCTIDITMPDGRKVVKVIGSLQTLTYSIHNDMRPVRAIGNMNAKDYVFGQRTIAGTLIFAVFNKHWAYDIMDEYSKAGNLGSAHFLMDELPPFQITISAANEYGFAARQALYGIRIVNEGQVISTNDIYTENTYQFVATDLDYLTECTGFVSPNTVNIATLPTINSTPLPSKPDTASKPITDSAPPPTDPKPPVPDPKPPTDPKPPSPVPVPANPYANKTEKETMAEIEKNRAADLAEVDKKLAAGEYKKGAAEANRVKTTLNAAYNQKAQQAKTYYDTKKGEK